MKVYLAAKYARRDELRGYKETLEKLGIEVTSNWLHERESLNGHMGDKDDSWYVETAAVDLADIDKADAVIFFAENPREGVPRGGRHVEFGYALKSELPIYVIGPKENVFHYRPRVYHFDTLEQFVESYEKYADRLDVVEV